MSVAEVFAGVVGPEAPIEFHAFDGSRAGMDGADIRVTLRSPEALAYVVTSPGALGLGRAYVSGELDVHGDVYTALKLLSEAALDRVGWADRVGIMRSLGPRLLRRPPRPVEEIVLSGRRHSKRRDASAVSSHYDVSNAFYSWVLGPSMAYTCAVYEEPDATLEEAQAAKFDLVCRKLGLRPGMRLLDVGCGWGGMAMHAAEHYGVHVIGVTLSEQQASWAQEAIKTRGLDSLAEVRWSDYRDVPETGFDAVSSIGLTEHIGSAELPSYLTYLAAKLHDGGRLLNHCITRPLTTEPAYAPHGFINRYVFPDGELEPVSQIIGAMADNGLEVRHSENLREHYAKTLEHWGENLDAHWDDAVAEVGAGRARVWRVYMAGSRLGFDRRKIELHQVLGVKTSAGGVSGMPLRPDWMG